MAMGKIFGLCIALVLFLSILRLYCQNLILNLYQHSYQILTLANQQIIPPILNSFLDQDIQVRYYACEALYNIAKVSMDILNFNL